MKAIPLRSRKYMNAYAYVDDDDYERIIAKGPWYLTVSGTQNKTGHCVFYAYRVERIAGKQKEFRMHRELIDIPEGYEPDHRDRNGLNNQKSNLRVVTRSQNIVNSRKRPECSSVHKGVSKRYMDGEFYCWRAYVNYDGKMIHLGGFNSEHEAALAYNRKAKELYGEHALLNVIPEDFVAGLPENIRSTVSRVDAQVKSGPRKGSSSRFKGVCFCKGKQKYQAYIGVSGELNHLGFFTDEEEAARAYNEAALKHFGAIAYQNDV